MTIYKMLKDSNPWQNIPLIPPYVLSQDKRYVDLYNEPLSFTDESYLHSELYPEQYAGKFNAKIVLLGKCPGFSPEDDSVHKGKIYRNLWKANISQSINDYPLYFLHPSLKNAPCYRWWHKKLKALINHTSVEAVANEVLEIQLFPYHCKRLRIIKASKAVPSRGFANKLVLSAIQREALIIIMESERLWKEHVPALHTYSDVYTVNSVRSGAISPGNLPNIYNKIVDAII